MMKREIDGVIQELRHATRESTRGNTQLLAADMLQKLDTLLREFIKQRDNDIKTGHGRFSELKIYKYNKLVAKVEVLINIA